MTTFEKYGRKWFTTRKEVEAERSKMRGRVYYDEGMKAYFITKSNGSIWAGE